MSLFSIDETDRFTNIYLRGGFAVRTLDVESHSG